MKGVLLGSQLGAVVSSNYRGKLQVEEGGPMLLEITSKALLPYHRFLNF